MNKDFIRIRRTSAAVPLSGVIFIKDPLNRSERTKQIPPTIRDLIEELYISVF
jgi:hypothetical protein